ncbi:AAA family ATPase [Pseudomonas sp. NPDC089734]|uniref:AAA family ATPase n=1 Tax=Pseudomonas sp. NPDC089734 TaxID=3364469 RepID=UPI0037FF35EF
MLIESINIPSAEFQESGLQDIKMRRLGRLVALAGKNGAGKSRLLNVIDDVIRMRGLARSGIDALKAEKESYDRSIRNSPNSSSINAWKEESEKYRRALLAVTEWTVTHTESFFSSMNFVPKRLDLVDPRKALRGEVANRAHVAMSPGETIYDEVCLFYLHDVLDQWFAVTHPSYAGNSDEKLKIEAGYEQLQVLMQRMLGVRLERGLHGDPMLFGKPIADARLSEGQRVLIQLCMALHAQGASLDNTVLLLDEPENHLHPSAVIEVVDALHKVTTTSQIWIATHSVPLLAYMTSIDPMCLWYVSSGGVTHAGRRPEMVLESLLGGEEGIAQLNAFSGLPAVLAAVNYATESLYPPVVLAGKGPDPQVSQIQSIIVGMYQKIARLRVLDVGAGKGRLLEGLAASMSDHGVQVAEVLDYHAYEPFPEDRAICEAVLASYYGDESKRYFSTPDQLFEQKDEASFALVVMCNVLHEIPPEMWVENLGRGGLVSRALSDNGFILIVEDQRIPVGEKAHKNGFLVLDTAHLKALFDIREADINDGLFVSHDARQDGRLKAHLIGKSLLGRITTQSVEKAIKLLRETSRREIRSLRDKTPSYANGQLNGFWTQQFANASLYLTPEQD